MGLCVGMDGTIQGATKQTASIFQHPEISAPAQGCCSLTPQDDWIIDSTNNRGRCQGWVQVLAGLSGNNTSTLPRAERNLLHLSDLPGRMLRRPIITCATTWQDQDGLSPVSQVSMQTAVVRHNPLTSLCVGSRPRQNRCPTAGI